MKLPWYHHHWRHPLHQEPRRQPTSPVSVTPAASVTHHAGHDRLFLILLLVGTGSRSVARRLQPLLFLGGGRYDWLPRIDSIDSGAAAVGRRVKIEIRVPASELVRVLDWRALAVGDDAAIGGDDTAVAGWAGRAGQVDHMSILHESKSLGHLSIKYIGRYPLVWSPFAPRVATPTRRAIHSTVFKPLDHRQRHHQHHTKHQMLTPGRVISLPDCLGRPILGRIRTKPLLPLQRRRVKDAQRVHSVVLALSLLLLL